MDRIRSTTAGSSEVKVLRKFSAPYKLKVLAEIDGATERGEVGKILRREGLYSSLISDWRRQRNAGALDGLNGKKHGPQSNALPVELKRLRQQNEDLMERLATAEKLIEAQGNAFALLQVMSRKSDGTQ